MISLAQTSPARPTAWLATLLGGLVAGTALWWLAGHVAAFGALIPQPLMLNDYLHGWLWAILLTAPLLLTPQHERAHLVVVWLLKCFVALGLMLLYESHYGLDAYWYFSTAAAGHSGPLWPVLGNGTETLLRLSVLVEKLTGPSYHAMKVVFSFLGLFACYGFYRAAVLYLGRRDVRVLYLVALTPTVLFWSTILGKEPLEFLGMGLYVWGTAGLLLRHRLGSLAPLASGVLIAAFVREWYALIMLVPLCVVFALRIRRLSIRLVAVTASLFGLVAAFRLFRAEFLSGGITQALAIANSINYGMLVSGGSATAVHEFHSPGAALAFLPAGMFTAIFRPQLWDARNLFMIAAAMEGTALLMLAISAVRHFSRSSLRDPILLWGLLLVVCWAGLYGIAGIGNLGALDRERLQIMPVLVLLLLRLGTEAGRNLTCMRPPRGA